MCCYVYLSYDIFFFFQAEDGIRDRNVTGVQTCALPIYAFARGQTVAGDSRECVEPSNPARKRVRPRTAERDRARTGLHGRSEERRVGKECRSRWAAEH